jgi:hypothetical protein
MIIERIDEFTGRLGHLSPDVDWAKWSIYVREAQDSRLMPVFGAEVIAWASDARAALAADENAAGYSNNAKIVLNALQGALANYAYVVAAPYLTLQVGDGGAMEMSSQNGQPARITILNKALEAALDTAERMVEQAQMFLDIAALDVADTLGGVWLAAEAQAADKTCWLNRYGQMSQRVDLASRAVFASLGKHLKRAQEDVVYTALGDETYTFLHTAWLAVLDGVPMTVPQAKAIDLARNVMAAQALAYALPLSGFVATATGVKVVNEGSVAEGLQQKTAANANEKQLLVERYQGQADRAVAKLKHYMAAHADVFTDFVPTEKSENVVGMGGAVFLNL